MNTDSCNNHLSLALSCAQMGTWNWEAPDGAMAWDAQMHALFGINRCDFNGTYERFLSLIHPEDQEHTAAEVAHALQQRTEYDGEFRVVRPSDGTIRFIRMRFRVIESESTESRHIAGVCWDVTERRFTERQLATKSALFNALMKYLPDQIYFKDRQSRFIAVSDEFIAARKSVDAAEVIGKTDFDYFSEEHARPAFEDEQRVIATGQPIIGVEEKETWLDGRISWVSTTKLPLRNEKGEIIGTFGLSRDITQRKQMEEELRAKNEALEQDLQMARELQTALLPQHYPCFPHGASDAESGVHFYHVYRPSMAVSGDFFDMLDIGDDTVGLFICDVMGHGVRAALVAAIVRTLVTELRPVWADPAEFLTQLNALLRSALRHTHIPLFASAFYVVADLAGSKLRYANAGHPPPLHIGRRKEEPPARLNGGKPGPALGLFDDARYQLHARPLAPHDVVLLFTDGLFEIESSTGEFYDYRRLVAAVGQRSDLAPPELCRGVIREIEQFSAQTEFADDVCLVTMEIERLQRS